MRGKGLTYFMVVVALALGALVSSWSLLMYLAPACGLIGMLRTRVEVAISRVNPLSASGLGIEAMRHPWRWYSTMFIAWTLGFLVLSSAAYGVKSLL